MGDFLTTQGLEYFFNKLDNFFIRKSILNQSSGTSNPLAAFPIGSIYLTTDSTNPASIFGGTWAAWGTGRVPIGVNTNDSDFSTAELTGGEKEHILTINEMPAHTHTYVRASYDDTGRHGANNTLYAGSSYDPDYETNSTGGDEGHNNMMPYITCYMWKRTQ